MVDYIDDLDADFLAIYGIGDMLSLPGPRWLALAHRLGAYSGVMAVRLKEAGERRGEATATATATEVRADAALAAVIDLG